MHAFELCLVLDVVIPYNFKMLNFVKYSGPSCPKAHMTMLYRKMAKHTGNDKLFIHYFQDSLTRSTARWNMKLDCNQIHTWSDLVKAFLAYHIVDIAPDHMSLMTMENKEIESFKDYTQRWHDIVS